MRKDIFPGWETYQTLVVRQHDDYLGVVVPNHPPKVCGGVWQRMLGNDKLVTPEVTLREHKVRIRSLILKDGYDVRLHIIMASRSVSSVGNVVASGNVTLYHDVGRVNVICSFHSGQRGQSDPCALRYRRAE